MPFRKRHYLFKFSLGVKRRLHIQFFYDLELHLGQILSLYVAKSLGQSLGQIFCFIEGQFLAQIKYQIVEQIDFVDAALLLTFKVGYIWLVVLFTGCGLCVLM